ncbi:unnamed protein product [Mytilus edulis]|uniref:Uncharacterized protein n=1 Tax=Mytilus edulis TaxID=6550 RepID=A0A8S3UWC1_MYTED|nr:unnamed protein product [Mytilus edulis]
MKDIMNKACSFGCIDTVTWLLDNEDHSLFDLKMAMCNTFNSNCLCKEELIQLLLQKCMVDELDMEINMNEACKLGLLKIVTWLIESVDHRLFDLNTAISHLYLHFTDRNQQIFKLLLANVSYKLFDLGIVIEQAFRQDLTEILIWLLQTKDHSLLDVKYVMNEACRVGNLRIIKHVCGTMGKEVFR